MTSTTIYPTGRCNLEQTPEDVRYSCNGGLDNHDNHQNNARHEEKYHLLDNESCFWYSYETTLHKSCQHWAAFDKEESRSKGKKNQYFLNSGFAGLIFITTIIIVIVSSPPSATIIIIIIKVKQVHFYNKKRKHLPSSCFCSAILSYPIRQQKSTASKDKWSKVTKESFNSLSRRKIINVLLQRRIYGGEVGGPRDPGRQHIFSPNGSPQDQGNCFRCWPLSYFRDWIRANYNLRKDYKSKFASFLEKPKFSTSKKGLKLNMSS